MYVHEISVFTSWCDLSKRLTSRLERKGPQNKENGDMLKPGICVHFIYCMAGNLAGNLFWWIGGFEINPPIFHPPKLCSAMSSLLQNHGFCVYYNYRLQLDALV